ncbi:hypothetical protein Ddc_16375 [Ditylenchus destructor]|nr:hypothetical protein Ddc_16375 [Ditylenchus destructor]
MPDVVAAAPVILIQSLFNVRALCASGLYHGSSYRWQCLWRAHAPFQSGMRSPSGNLPCVLRWLGIF